MKKIAMMLVSCMVITIAFTGCMVETDCMGIILSHNEK